MDAFVKIKTLKKTPLKISGRGEESKLLDAYKSLHNIVWVWGGVGVGKTYFVTHSLDCRFIENPGGTTTMVAVYDNVIEPQWFSTKCNICISNLPPPPDVVSIYLEPLPYPIICEICNCQPPEHLNLRDAVHYSLFPYNKDLFIQPKDVIDKLLHHEIDWRDKIGDIFQEHGNTISIVHENYRHAETLEDVTYISECLSIADVYDNANYKGYWDLLYCQCHHGIIEPLSRLKKMQTATIPGTSWTKFNNKKSREANLKKLDRRLCIDALYVLRDYIMNDQYDMIKEYGIKMRDIYTINHVLLRNKLKTSKLNILKKHEFLKNGKV